MNFVETVLTVRITENTLNRIGGIHNSINRSIGDLLGNICIHIGMCIHGLIHLHSTDIRSKLIETGIMDFTIESYLINLYLSHTQEFQSEASGREIGCVITRISVFSILRF